MKKAVAVALVAAFLAGFAMSRSGSADRLAQTERSDLMKQKLEDAQNLLEGLALEDFEQIEQSAKQLNQLSIEAQWTDAYSPLYGKFGTEFRNATDRITQSAEERNVDGAALSYVQLVLVCVHCHKSIRGSEDLAFKPERLLDGIGD